MKSKILTTILLLIAASNVVLGQTVFENSRFKFKATIPEDWRFHQEIKGDSLHYTIVGWGLPKVYDELEKLDVENAISISAIKHSSIKNVEDVVQAEFNRTKNVTILNRVQLDSVEHTAYFTNSLINYVSYATHQYFVFKNDIGYIITFTATLGTSDINLDKFKAFYEALVFE